MKNFFLPAQLCLEIAVLIQTVLVLELMKHPSAEAAATATLYQRCLNVDKIKYLPLEDSGFHSNERIPHKTTTFGEIGKVP